MNKIQNYLRESVDDHAVLHIWNPKEKLNLYLSGSFRFYLTELLEVQFLLIQPYEQGTVQKLKKQMDVISEKTDLPVAVLLEESTGYRVKKMIQERVPFICAEHQLYLPFLALQIRRQRRPAEIDLSSRFTPSTQLIYLKLLYSDQKEFGLEELTEQLGLSSMTVVRGMNELAGRGLLGCQIAGQTGRKKIFIMNDKKEYWNRGRNLLINPVQKTIYVKTIPDNMVFYKSGLTALGEQTMLAEPDQPVFAAEYRMEEQLRPLQIPKDIAMEEALPAVQLMRYRIDLLTDTEYIDPVTLMLCLNDRDDRIEIALHELLEGKEWFVE